MTFAENYSLLNGSFRNGHLVAFDKNVNAACHEYTEGLPMLLKARNGSIYAEGKSHTLLGFHYNGTLKWKLQI